MTIEEIKTIEITLIDDDVNEFNFNGCNEKEYTLKIQKDNALRVARALTRMAKKFWDKFDIIANEE